MLFSSITFLFMFLPIVLLLYLVTKKELHNPILLIASIIFYAWGEPKYLAIMFLTILINWLGAIAIDKFHNNKKFWLFLTITANLGFLIYFKYYNFIIQNVSSLFHSDFHLIKVIMPIGISFYTFQALSYVIDVYRDECKVQKDIYKLALYICLFPQLIAGPIVKYHDVEEQINSREVDFEKVNLGVKRFIIGFSKKVLIANTLGAVADKIFIQNPHSFSPLVAWIGSLSYTFQIYFDFSGYSDMAIGLGLIFGFRFLENFNYPYISTSITEFWRRWHISLSTWFKQYVYIPLGGNKNGKIKTLRNLGIVFLLTGIWHGAAWNFIFWGLWHGFFIILEKTLGIKKFEQKQHNIFVKFFQHVYCLIVVLIGWIMFRAESITYFWHYLMNMLGFLKIHTDKILYTIYYYIDTFEVIVFVAAILCSTPVFGRILEIKNKYAQLLINIWLLFLFVFSSATIASDTYNPFIYFRF